MESTDILKKEHRAIESVLNSLDRAAHALRHGKAVPPQIFADGIDFIRNFADRCHHGKEEDRLFPLLIERGFPSDRGPIHVMLTEHEEGRDYVRKASENFEKWNADGDKEAGMTMAVAIERYIDLLRQHIQKEDHILYPMGEERMSAEDDQLLVKQFDEVEEQEMGPGVHEQYHAMIDRLADETAKL